MGCNSCCFLDENNKKEGICGSLHYCHKLKKYVNCSKDSCDNYEKDYSKTSYSKNELYEEGKKYYSDSTPIEFQALVLIIMIIAGSLAKLFI